MSRVLVIDDEPSIRRTLEVSLRAHGYVVDLAEDGNGGLLLAQANNPDAVVLDLGLPGLDGIEVLRRLRLRSDVPVVILSVRDAEAQKVEALDAGADDYVTKPFSMPELLARLRSALRRHAPPADDPVVETAHFRLDLVLKQSWREGSEGRSGGSKGGSNGGSNGGSEVHLTPTEWGLVEYLVRNPGRLVTQRELLHHVWGPNCPHEPAYLRVHMSHVRRKLEPNASRPRYFITEAGMGYRFLAG